MITWVELARLAGLAWISENILASTATEELIKKSDLHVRSEILMIIHHNRRNYEKFVTIDWSSIGDANRYQLTQ